MAPQTITPGCRAVWRVTVRLVSHRCPGRLQTRLRWSSGLNSKRDLSLKTILLQSVTFQVGRARYHYKRTYRCTKVNGSRRKGHRDLSPLSLSRLLMALVVTETPVAPRIDDNDESGAVSAALTIDRSSRSVVSRGRPLTS